MVSEDTLLRQRQGAQLRLVLNRPATLNSVDAATLSALTAAVEEAGNDPQVRVVVLTGNGRAFCSGADVATRDQSGADGGTLAAANRAVQAIRTSDKPVVAAVNGLAAGVGASLALACDVVVAQESAYFLLAFTNIGLMPDGGATAVIPAAIGRARALRMALMAERVSATVAEQWGLIGMAVEEAKFTEVVEAVAAKLAAGPPLAIAETKRAINEFTLERFDAALDCETTGQRMLMNTEDFREGIRAFRQKRRPAFNGR
ncbi:enoyl-CoA hydratase [Mycobacterium vicinigordonae]|uniref:Enoyl-CoA hydratase n=1 Tax=Mycobacterium vicinigordonae TaxID=1719132 RepID=A0A7D6E3D2_9MYCO|nr:enoyl-CoA hydratase [Mycobacterium vicinigordonae]QLL06382.1 enoyl-CoA hydratase [Mycobacterium vicinigordonae]